MPSQLLNRVHRVQWGDFHGHPPQNATLDAHIETKVDLNYGYRREPNGTAQLTDAVTVTIQLVRHLSWAKKQRINSWPQQAQDDLLRHEQGHYDITALMGRDMFLDLMELKPRSFPSLGALQTAVNGIVQRYAPQAIHVKYDSAQESDHGRNATQQRAWDGYINTALTQPRSPVVTAPDGAVYKARLLEVLHRVGKA
jgi:hypothetical protein